MSVDKGQGKTDLEAKTGMSTLDLLGGTPAVNRVVRLMLHKNRMTYGELRDAVAQLPPEKRLSREDLDAALEDLVQRDWLNRTEENGEVVYQVVLRPKASSAEQLHSDNLPRIEVAVDKNVNPQIGERAKKKGGLLAMLGGIFGAKK